MPVQRVFQRESSVRLRLQSYLRDRTIRTSDRNSGPAGQLSAFADGDCGSCPPGRGAGAEPCERGVCQTWGEEPAGTGVLFAGEEGAVKQAGEAANLPELSEQDTVY